MSAALHVSRTIDTTPDHQSVILYYNRLTGQDPADEKCVGLDLLLHQNMPTETAQSFADLQHVRTNGLPQRYWRRCDIGAL